MVKDTTSKITIISISCTRCKGHLEIANTADDKDAKSESTNELMLW
jgi:hypothetical protein